MQAFARRAQIFRIRVRYFLVTPYFGFAVLYLYVPVFKQLFRAVFWRWIQSVKAAPLCRFLHTLIAPSRSPLQVAACVPSVPINMNAKPVAASSVALYMFSSPSIALNGPPENPLIA